MIDQPWPTLEEQIANLPKPPPSCELFTELMASEYADQMPKLMAAGEGEIDHTFLVCSNAYEHLAKVIPLGRTIVDLGCAQGFQAWYFHNHRQYIGVNGPWHNPNNFLKTKNSLYLTCGIDDFMSKDVIQWDPQESFVICNYVPANVHTNLMRVRAWCPHLFIFYPEAGDNPGSEVSFSQFLERRKISK